jgi:hypothetical protein
LIFTLSFIDLVIVLSMFMLSFIDFAIAMYISFFQLLNLLLYF